MNAPKRAIVTGGCRGIGRAIAQRLVRDGVFVIVADVDDAAGAEMERAASNEELRYFHADVASCHDFQKVVEEVDRRFGAPSILVNNAGIQHDRLFVDMTENEWRELMNVDLDSLYNCTHPFLGKAMAAGWGRVVNISSMSARRGSSQHVHYCTAKAGVLGFTRALSLEIAAHGITVNAICPGIVDTEMVAKKMLGNRDAWLREMHVKRFGTPEDIANMAAFLISEEADWITGQAFDVNGGIITP
jgi:3-oxoacyl-[acyl-carrier protein] reductase